MAFGPLTTRRADRPSECRPRAAAAQLAVLACCLPLVIGPGCQQSDTTPELTQKVTLRNQVFELELAMNEAARYQGLSDRQSIPPSGGMLFVFPSPGRLQFVMRRCLVPIDLIFLDPGGRVIATHAMTVEPADTPEERLHRYSSRYAAQFAIELRGGTLTRLNLEPGEKIDLPLERLKRQAR